MPVEIRGVNIWVAGLICLGLALLLGKLVMERASTRREGVLRLGSYLSAIAAAMFAWATLARGWVWLVGVIAGVILSVVLARNANGGER